jgi:endonuclease/exonuclease/phosphatase family metal-dependent hydrolase
LGHCRHSRHHRVSYLDCIGPLIFVAETRVRVLQLNCRRSDLVELYSSRRWANRRGELIKVLRQVDASVMGFQEATREQIEYIEAQLGADRYAYFGTHNVRVLVNITIHRVLNWWGFDLPDSSMSIGPRHVVACHLQKIATGGTFLAASTHLTPHNTPGAQAARVEQMHVAAQKLRTFPDFNKLIFMADINDSSKSGGVRGAAGEYGLKDLRARLTADEMYYERLNTFNGWRQSKADSVWIDAILTAPGAKPYRAGVERTDLKRPLARYATDHNGLRASISLGEAGEVA